MTPHADQPEPWLRGTLSDIDAVRRQVLHALELATEDVAQWCFDLSDGEMHLRPFGIAPPAYHLRHVPRSLDRLLTYAAGEQLSPAQLASLAGELDQHSSRSELLGEFTDGIAAARGRILRIPLETYEEKRYVGRQQLPSSVGGLLVHCAEHTQRHSGQLVTTSKILIAMREQRPR